jgi:hypothetical protein
VTGEFNRSKHTFKKNKAGTMFSFRLLLRTIVARRGSGISRFSSFSKDSNLASFGMEIFYTKIIREAILPASQRIWS